MPVDQSDIEDEIAHGFQNEKPRLDEARLNAQVADGDFSEQINSWKYPEEAHRTVLLASRVLDVLTSNLYREGPSRSFADSEAATEYLQAIYRENAADSLWQEADRLSLLNQVAAFEVYGNVGAEGEPEDDSEERPVGIQPWGAEELIVWLDPDNARKPIAVATIDTYDAQRRLRLWTRYERVTFVTSKGTETARGTAFEVIDRIPNPYGVIPFSFVHARFPARYFWSCSPDSWQSCGSWLRLANEHANERLTVIAEDVLKSRPQGVIEGTAGDFAFGEREPGIFKAVPAVSDAGGNVAADPRMSYVVCDFGYLGQDTEELWGWLERALELVGVPQSAYRMGQTSVKSGAALIAEQEPLIRWAEGRQRPFGYYEQALARLVMRVSVAHAQANGRGELLGCPVGEMDAAARSQLTLRWPKMRSFAPGPDKDAHSQFLLDNHLATRRDILLDEHPGMTAEEADAKLAEIDAEREAEAALAEELNPIPEPQPGDNEDGGDESGSGNRNGKPVPVEQGSGG